MRYPDPTSIFFFQYFETCLSEFPRALLGDRNDTAESACRQIERQRTRGMYETWTDMWRQDKFTCLYLFLYG